MPKNPEKSHASSRQGRVIAYFGSTVTVETSEGEQFTCHWRRNQCLPVVGDEVIFERELNGEGGVILEILPRKRVLMRAERQRDPKPIAANIDDLVIVMPPPPGFSANLLDQYAIAAELLGIRPVVLLNKSDLLDEAACQQMASTLACYAQVPYPVLFTSCETGAGLTELENLLAGRTAVMVGPSGVGKSSLIQRLCQDEGIRIGEVSDKGAGKHTTTATRLYPVIGGGALIDSPGVRDFTLWSVSKEEALRGFPEFKPYLTGCQFRDCSHAVEPGCSLQAAVQAGKVSRERFKTFQFLLQQANKKQK